MSYHHRNKGILFLSTLSLLLAVAGCDDSHGNASQEPDKGKCTGSAECGSNKICYQEVCTPCANVDSSSLTGDDFCICNASANTKCTNGNAQGYCCDHVCVTDAGTWNKNPNCGCNTSDNICTQSKECTPLDMSEFNVCLIDGKECKEDSHCEQNSDRKYCDLTTNQCVVCKEDSHCDQSSDNKHCDLQSHQCVECTGNEHCTGSNETCNMQEHKCEVGTVVNDPCDKDKIVESLNGKTDIATCANKTKEKINWLIGKGEGAFEFTSATETSEDTCLIICGDADLSDDQNAQVTQFKAFTKTIESDATILGIDKPTLTVDNLTEPLLPSKKLTDTSFYVEDLKNIVVKNLKINANNIEYDDEVMRGIIATALENSVIEDIELTLNHSTVKDNKHYSYGVGLLVGKMIKGGNLSGCKISVRNTTSGSTDTDNIIDINGLINSFGGFLGIANAVDVIGNTLDVTYRGEFKRSGGFVGEMRNGSFNDNTFTGAILAEGNDNFGGFIATLNNTEDKTFKNNHLILSDFVFHGGKYIGGLVGKYNSTAAIEDSSVLIKSFVPRGGGIRPYEYTGLLLGGADSNRAKLKNVQSIILRIDSHETFYINSLIGNEGDTKGIVTEDSENVLQVNVKGRGIIGTQCDDNLTTQMADNSTMWKLYKYVGFQGNNFPVTGESEYLPYCGTGISGENITVSELTSRDPFKQWKKYCYTGDTGESHYGSENVHVQFSIPLPFEPPEDWGFTEGFCPVSGETE